jgi:hypothetical protein
MCMLVYGGLFRYAVNKRRKVGYLMDDELGNIRNEAVLG